MKQSNWKKVFELLFNKVICTLQLEYISKLWWWCSCTWCCCRWSSGSRRCCLSRCQTNECNNNKRSKEHESASHAHKSCESLQQVNVSFKRCHIYSTGPSLTRCTCRDAWRHLHHELHEAALRCNKLLILHICKCVSANELRLYRGKNPQKLHLPRGYRAPTEHVVPKALTPVFI